MNKDNKNIFNTIGTTLKDYFFSNNFSRIGLVLILIVIFLSISADIICEYGPNTQGDLVLDRYLSPSFDHPFGTDKFGRDIFSRVLFGGRASLIIAFSVVFISIVIGMLYGMISGYFGGKVDIIMMRLLDFLLAFPLIFIVITAIAIFDVSRWYLIPILALSSWMETARLVRAEVLSLKEREYIMAANGFGFSPWRIIFNHIMPNCLNVVFVVVPLKIAEIILLETALSFLGIGIQPPTPSWGNIINDGREVLLHAWWISTFPGIFISMTVLSFYLMGDGLKNRIKGQSL